MPIDYGNGPDSVVDKTWNGKTYKGKKYPKTAIMDGGIVDNQGIEGVKLAEKRHMEDDDAFIGTYIVSDVSGEFMKPYEVPVLKDGGIGNFFTIRGVNIFLAVLFVAISCVLYFVDLSTLQTVLLASFLPLIVVWFLVYFFVLFLGYVGFVLFYFVRFLLVIIIRLFLLSLRKDNRTIVTTSYFIQ